MGAEARTDMMPDESPPAPPMRPELVALADWLRLSGRMPHLDYECLLLQVVAIAERATLMTGDQPDVDAITRACDAVQTHLAAAVRDQDPAALILVLEHLLPLARAVGDNPLCLLVAVGLLTDEEIADYLAEQARRVPPPAA